MESGSEEYLAGSRNALRHVSSPSMVQCEDPGEKYEVHVLSVIAMRGVRLL